MYARMYVCMWRTVMGNDGVMHDGSVGWGEGVRMDDILTRK